MHAKIICVVSQLWYSPGFSTSQMSLQKIKHLTNLIQQWRSGLIVLRGPSGCGKLFALQKACQSLGLSWRLVDDDFASCLAKLDSLGVKQVLVTKNSNQINTVYSKHIVPFSILEENDVSYRFSACAFQTVVTFTAYSDSAIRAIILESNPDVPPDVLEDCVCLANGDARQALIQLELRGINPTLIQSANSKKRRRKATVVSLSDKSSSSAARDNAFSLFHTLGKILYNKEGLSTDCDALSSQPVIADAGHIPILCLHENLPDFSSDIDSLEKILSDFGFSDIYLRFSEDSNRFVFRSVTAHNTNNGGRSVSGFSALRKPRSSKACLTKELLSEIKWEIPNIRPDTVHLIDFMMKATGGQFPPLSVHTRQNIFNYMHLGSDFAIEKARHSLVVFPTELEDDPISD